MYNWPFPLTTAMGEVKGEFAAAKQEVDAILASGVFNASSRQAKLLEYLFNKVVQGHADDLKEYTIALELFQKPASFDQHADATVRVEAHRLRKKLLTYYETAGRDHQLRVMLPAGQYRLHFESARPDAAVVRQLSRDTTGRGVTTRIRLAVAAGAAAILVMTASVWLYYAPHPRAKAPKTVTAAVQAPRNRPPDPEPEAIRLLAGHTGDPYIDRSGRRWQPDRYFDGGTVCDVNRPIGRTGRPQLFRRVREGTCRYHIPLRPGEYELRLYFTDPDDPEEERSPQRRFRIMTVTVNGRQLLAPYELEAEAGQNGDVRSLAPVRAGNGGVLDLLFWSARGPAAISAIELVPMVQGHIRPIRITAQTRPYEDTQGRLWLPDDYYSGGKLGGYQAMIDGGGDPGIYCGERIGDFDYFIPVPAGRYQVTLYFAEGWWGSRENGGSAGTRVFNVLLNGEPVLRGFDMLREARPRELVVRAFRRVSPDRYGKIHLTFAARADYASVRAIEVLPEQ